MTRRAPSATTATLVPESLDAAAQTGRASDAVVDHHPLEAMTAQERAAVRRGLADLRAGRLASDDEINAVFRRFRP